MWAFALLDLRKKVLFCSRDFPGVKPFYYYHEPGRLFVFASEAKAFYPLDFVPLSVDDGRIFDYLTLSKVEQDGDTFFKEIKELQPGNSILLSLDNLELKTKRFRVLCVNESYEKYSEEKAKIYAIQVRELLFKAVKRRLQSDVPIGSCLSGGLDSSTIVMIVNKLLKHERIDQIGERQKVFTAVFNGYPIDESKWARIVVEHGNIEWHVTNPTFEELIRDMEDLIYYQDFPFPSTSIYASYRVMKLVAEKGVKVSLDGQGADELFTGYHPYYSYFYKELVKNGNLATLISEVFHYRNSPLNSKQFLLRLLLGLSPNRISLPLLTAVRSRIYPLKRDFYNYYSQRIRERIEKSLSIRSLNEALIVNTLVLLEL